MAERVFVFPNWMEKVEFAIARNQIRLRCAPPKIIETNPRSSEFLQYVSVM